MADYTHIAEGAALAMSLSVYIIKQSNPPVPGVVVDSEKDE
jgi:hypothetical protein